MNAPCSFSRVVRKLTYDVVQEFVRSCKPMFVASGYAPALIDRLTEGTDKGINLVCAILAHC